MKDFLICVLVLTPFWILLNIAISILSKFNAARCIRQYERGVKFAQEEIADCERGFYFGRPENIWHTCDPSFDNSPFDRGVADELTRQGIRHPTDPLGE